MSDRIRDMLFERRHRHLPGHRAPCRPYCRLEGGRLIVGVQSAHRTNASRKWRTQLRLIRARAAAEIGKALPLNAKVCAPKASAWTDWLAGKEDAK